MKKNRKLYTLIFLTSLFFMQCITYTRFPKEKVDSPPKKIKTNNTFSYYIYDSTGFRFFGGAAALTRVLKNENPYGSSLELDQEPQTGQYVKVVIKKVDPNIAALIFGYLGLGTLTVLPFWSTEDGYDLQYEIKKDGKLVKAFQYEVRRSGFIWLPMLVVSWVNAFTYSEKEAFEATAYKFFDDAAPILEK